RSARASATLSNFRFSALATALPTAHPQNPPEGFRAAAVVAAAVAPATENCEAFVDGFLLLMLTIFVLFSVISVYCAVRRLRSLGRNDDTWFPNPMDSRDSDIALHTFDSGTSYDSGSHHHGSCDSGSHDASGSDCGGHH